MPARIRALHEPKPVSYADSPYIDILFFSPMQQFMRGIHDRNNSFYNVDLEDFSSYCKGDMVCVG